MTQPPTPLPAKQVRLAWRGGARTGGHWHATQGSRRQGSGESHWEARPVNNGTKHLS